MDADICREIGRIVGLKPPQIRRFLRTDPERLLLTKALVNILYNIVKIRSILPTRQQKRELETHIASLNRLLSRGVSLKAKAAILASQPSLVIALARSCKRPDW